MGSIVVGRHAELAGVATVALNCDRIVLVEHSDLVALEALSGPLPHARVILRDAVESETDAVLGEAVAAAVQALRPSWVHLAGTDAVRLLGRYMTFGSLQRAVQAAAEAELIAEALPPSREVTVFAGSDGAEADTLCSTLVERGFSVHRRHGEDDVRSIRRPLRSSIWGLAARMRSRLGSPRPARRTTDARRVAMCVSSPVHLRILDGVARELVSRGWQCVYVDLSGDESLRAVVPGAVRFADHHFESFVCRTLRAAALMAKKIAPIPAGYFHDRALVPYQRRVLSEVVGFLGTSGPALARAATETLLTVDARAVLVVDELGLREQSLAVAAKHLGIRSMAVQHGHILQRSWWRDLPYDVVGVRGAAYAEALSHMGRQAEGVMIVGDPAPGELVLTSESPPERSSRTVLYVGQYATDYGPNSEEALRLAFEMLVDACNRLPGVEIVLRPHPLSGGRDRAYLDVMERYPDVKCYTDTDTPLGQLLQQVDVVAVHESTVGIEAALDCRRVLVVNPATPERPLLPLAEEGVAVLAESSQDVYAVLAGLFDNDEWPIVSQDARARFGARFAALRDSESAISIVDGLERLIGAASLGDHLSESGA